MLSSDIFRYCLYDIALYYLYLDGSCCKVDEKSNRRDKNSLTNQRYSQSNNIGHNCCNQQLSLCGDLVDKSSNKHTNDSTRVYEGLESIDFNIAIASIVSELCGE